MDQDSSELDLENRQVWLRAFYGFDPEGSGYIGFTNEGDRRAMLEQMRDGDLVLIYGAVEELTDQSLRAQALGFLEVTLDICGDRERMSDDAYAWKVERGFQERWTNGIKVRRAWRVRNRVGIKTIAPEAYQGKHRFTRTTRAILLDQDERRRALSHPVQQTNVFGEPTVTIDELSSGPMGQVLKPSRGIPPSFGDRSSTHEDGENFLYLMLLTADAKTLLGDAFRPGYALAKIGRSNDPARRLGEINAGYPESAIVKWELKQKQAFADGATAHNHEDNLKAIFDTTFSSLGGEFFTGGREELLSAFQNYCVANMPKILGAAAKARGI